MNHEHEVTFIKSYYEDGNLSNGWNRRYVTKYYCAFCDKNYYDKSDWEPLDD